VEARKREEHDKDALREAWLAQGHDERDFAKHYPALRDEHNRSKLEELERGARDASHRAMWRSF